MTSAGLTRLCLQALAVVSLLSYPPARVSASNPTETTTGPSMFCHVTDGAFTICPDGSQEWSDVAPVAFPTTDGVVYADQADLVDNSLIADFEAGLIDSDELFVPDGELDHLMLMYESDRPEPLGLDEYMLVHFMTVDSDEAKLQHYVVRIYSEASIQVLIDGVDQGPGRLSEIDTMQGSVGFASSPTNSTPHVISEFQIGLEEAGFTVCCYSPDPAWWSSTIPNRPPVARDDDIEIDDNSVTVNVAANDTDIDGSVDPSTVAIVTPPEHGTAVANSDGTVTYTRGQTFKHGDSFTYMVRDNEGAGSNTATVDVVRRCSPVVGDSLDGKSAPWAAGELTKRGTDVDQDNLKHEDELDLGTDPCHHDTDGDGLIDSWEARPGTPGAGFDLNSDGLADVSRDEVFGPYAPLPNVDKDNSRRVMRGFFGQPPDPLHKDAYLQIDWQDCRLGGCFEVLGVRVDDMHHAPDLQALQDVIAMFASQPVANPDAVMGVNLNILVDESLIHAPNCDQPPSAARDANFGTPDQRRDAQVRQAKALAFRYAWSGHSTFRNDDGDCPTPGTFDVIRIGLGLIPLPDYDTTPFGQALVEGRDVLVTLGPLWTCPSEPLINDPRCDRGFLSPGIFPAKARVDGNIVDLEKPYARLLGRPHPTRPEVGEERGITQLWGRTLAHLLGHALGIADHGLIDNEPAKSDPLPAGLNYWMPEPYAVVSGLVYARSLYDVSSTGDHLQFTPRDDQSGLLRITESTPFDNPIDDLLDTDRDGDGVVERLDNCSGFSDPGQEDLDLDGLGDACDPDQDQDGLRNDEDAFPHDTDNDGLDNEEDEDDDGDGVLDAADTCALTPDPGQEDLDGDGQGDACDLDADDDGLPAQLEEFVGSDPLKAVSQPEFVGGADSCSDGLDNDLDGKVDGADEGCQDADGDSMPDFLDPCPQVPDVGWVDSDSDGLGNACDEDDDGDGFGDDQERELGSDPFDPQSTPEHASLPDTCTDGLDNDGDGLLDVQDPDCLGAAGMGMVVDLGTDRVIVFDVASDTVVGSVPVGPGGTLGDCSITADGRLGFATDFNSRLWVIDLASSPPALAAGTNPIPILNFGEDTSITPDQRFVVVVDGSGTQPISVVSIAARAEVSTFSLGSDHNSVEVLSDGSVLVTSNNTGNIYRLTIDSSGNLSDTGEVLFSGGAGFLSGPNNVFADPGARAGIVVRREPRQIRSFTIPGMTLVDTRNLTGTSFSGISGVVHPIGDKVYARSNGGAVDIFAFDPETAQLGPAPLLSIPIASAPTFFGMDQMAITSDGNKLYVSQPGALLAYNAQTGDLLTTITDPALSQPTGVCLAPAEAPEPPPGPPDVDGDGVPDAEDNCPAFSNPDQADLNFDGIGDACEDTFLLATTAFLRPNLDGTTVIELTEPSEGEPPLAEQLARIIEFRLLVLRFSIEEALDFLQSLVQSQVDLGLVAPGEAENLIEEVLIMVNQPPVVDAGPDQAVECSTPQGAIVALDGTASTDPDGDVLTFSWIAVGIVFDDPISLTPSATFPLGNTTVTLVVNDGLVDSAPDTVDISVQDTTPPTLSAEWVSLDGEEDEGKFVLEFGASDACDPTPQVIGVVETPNLDGLEIELKTKSKVRIEFNFEEGKVEIQGPDPEALLAQLQEFGGLVVDTGQLVKVKLEEADEGEQEFKFEKDGTLRIKAPIATVKVTGEDASGNTARQQASPQLAPEEDDDDEHEEDGEDNGKDYG